MKHAMWVTLLVSLFLSCRGGATPGPDGGVIRCGGFAPTPTDCPDGSVCEQTMQNCADCTGVCYPK